MYQLYMALMHQSIAFLKNKSENNNQEIIFKTQESDLDNLFYPEQLQILYFFNILLLNNQA